MFRRKQRNRELERELRSHLDLEAEEQRERGMSPDEARYAAQRALGNATLIKEQAREVWGWRWLERFKQDLSYAIRTFRRVPGFTAVVILTLALGIGATTAIFSIVNAVLLHPLPYKSPERLVVIWEKLAHDSQNPPVFDSYRDFEAWKNRSKSFETLAPATWATEGHIVTGAGPARGVLAMPVGIDFFSLLGAAPAMGRTFRPDDLHRDCTVVLSHRFWTEEFGQQRHAVGGHISLNETACTVIGVMPAGFAFYPDAASMWMLITPASKIARDPDNSNVGVFGLLKPGVSIQQAENEVRLLYDGEHRKDSGGIARVPFVYPLAEQFAYLTGPTLRRSVAVLFGAVGFVLLIACVNIANLLLSRSLTRQRELAVRVALGSGRLRLIRQLLTEGVLLSCAGALFGTGLAAAAVHWFRAWDPIQLPPGADVRVNLWVLGFTAALAVLTALLFALAPALKASRVDVIEALKAGGRSASMDKPSRAAGKLLVIAEVMLSLALLVGAALLIQSVNRLLSVPLGFNTDHVMTLDITLPQWSYSTDVQRSRFYRKLLDRVAGFPGVASVALASSAPLSYARYGGSVLAVEGRPRPDPKSAPHDTQKVLVSPGYFHVMGVRPEGGREFSERDVSGSPGAAIVNEALVRKYFPRGNPIGERLQVGEPGPASSWLTVVGVVADEKDQDFFHQMAWREIPLVFRPLDQEPPSRASLVLRTPAENLALGPAIQKQIAAIDPGVPVGDVQTLNGQLARAMSYPRFRALIFGVFAALALLLAAVGLYGVLSRLVVQRTQEFGIRLALGAQKQDVLKLVVWQGMLLTAAGVAAGLAITLGLTRVLSGLLFGIEATDPLTLAGVSLLLLIVAFIASYVPARRASKADPITALRYE